MMFLDRPRMATLLILSKFRLQGQTRFPAELESG